MGLTRQIADHILFEERNSPPLTFVIVAEPDGRTIWLQVRDPKGMRAGIRSTSAPLDPGWGSPGYELGRGLGMGTGASGLENGGSILLPTISSENWRAGSAWCRMAAAVAMMNNHPVDDIAATDAAERRNPGSAFRDNLRHS